MRSLLALLAAGTLVCTVACGGGSIGITTPNPPTPPPIIPAQIANVKISTTQTGSLKLAMSTSFQPAEWDDQFFTNAPNGTTTLGGLLPQHIRLQAISEGVPQTTASTWDFSVVDAITQPVLGVGDHSPEFQIAKGPAFFYDSNGNFLDLSFQPLAAYAQNLVRYYNTGGFTSTDGKSHVSASPNHITYWGIYNEPNINNNLTPSQYVQLYNTLVPAMQAVDPSLKFVGIELADFSNQPQNWVPTFVSGVTAQVDVIATHFYSTCNQKDSDTQVFNSIPGFASDVTFFYNQMKTNPKLASVPVWITENNVNADFDAGGGISACNGGTFVTDKRGSSAFFAAWRPYVFSQLGKVGAQALYHWDFDADAQYGEVDYSTGNHQLSYWVDYWLARMFPATQNILQFTTNDSTDVEVLPVKNSDGSFTIMLANHAVAAASDNNGNGSPREIDVDISSLGTFSSASLLTIDTNTNASLGPIALSQTPATVMKILLNGYGVAFLTLKP